jgi:hypothetical protein
MKVELDILYDKDKCKVIFCGTFAFSNATKGVIFIDITSLHCLAFKYLGYASKTSC